MERVAQGGHHVPAEDVRRRYQRSLIHLRKVLELVDEAMLYDNSGPELRKLAQFQSGRLLWRTTDDPTWAKPLIDSAHR